MRDQEAGQPDGVGGRDARPSRSSGLTLVGLLGGAVLVAVVLGQLTSPEPAPRPPIAVATSKAPDAPRTSESARPIGVESLKRCPVKLGGLTLGDRPQLSGSALERWDCDALTGPWSVVIRATGGHFGVDSAVVTFPAVQEGSGTPVTQPRGGEWDAIRHRLVWPLAGAHLQIVGDIGQTGLADLAMRIMVVGGRPRLSAPDGFTVAATLPYRSRLVREMRYGAKDLGQSGALGDGLVFTGVTSGASVESLALESHARPAGFVRGKPSIYSEGQGGNGILAWELAIGQVAYIGYSGSGTNADAIDALRTLADKGRLLTPAQWETKDRA